MIRKKVLGYVLLHLYGGFSGTLNRIMNLWAYVIKGALLLIIPTPVSGSAGSLPE